MLYKVIWPIPPGIRAGLCRKKWTKFSPIHLDLGLGWVVILLARKNRVEFGLAWPELTTSMFYKAIWPDSPGIRVGLGCYFVGSKNAPNLTRPVWIASSMQSWQFEPDLPRIRTRLCCYFIDLKNLG